MKFTPKSSPAILRAVGYVRVSTRDKQVTENQAQPIEKYCWDHSYDLLEIYTDKESGTSTTRENFLRMMRDAGSKPRRFDILVVWALDRLTREGVAKTFEYLSQLRTAGIEFESVQEPQFNTTGPFADVFIALAAAIGRMEHERISSRVKAGIEVAKQQGIRMGRRPVEVSMAAIHDVTVNHMPIRFAAQCHGIAVTTLHKAVAKYRSKNVE